MAFDLRKSVEPVPKKKGNVLGTVILVVVVTCGLVAYFMGDKKTAAIGAGVSEPVTIAAAAVPASNTVTNAPPIAAPAQRVAAPARVMASFNKGAATPNAVDDEILNEIKPGRKVVIYGYASSEGDLSLNRQLSYERASAVKQYLISRGVAGELVTAVGKGIDNPVATNDTELGRAQNRRVEIHIE